jgi:putative flippase GtrA
MVGGSMTVAVYWAILFTLTEYFKVWYVTSSILGWITSYIMSFIVQKFWTFKNREENATSKQFLLYIVMAICILVSNTISLYILVEYAKLEYVIAQVIISIPLTFASFFSTRKIFATN